MTCWCPRHIVSSSCRVPVVSVSLSRCILVVSCPVTSCPRPVMSPLRRVSVLVVAHVVSCLCRVVSVSSSCLMLCRVPVVSCPCCVLSLSHCVRVLTVSRVVSMSLSSTWRDVTLSHPVAFPSSCCVVSSLLSG